ncbi:MAG: helix-turn-helix transcriptional regulator [Liquorilactobacillus sp.]|uniref:helix-turn-helix domain-containing protein n=1 Tax=Liquorilactobacillus nagelii TaxID=82688 RepID=UPI0039ED42DD
MLKFDLKHLMETHHLSIQDVSDKTGISRNTVSQLYNNKSRGIQFETLSKLLNGLGVELYDLFDNSSDLKNLRFDVSYSSREELEFKKSDDGSYFPNIDSTEFAEVSFFDEENSTKEFTVIDFRIPLGIELKKNKHFTAIEFYSYEELTDDNMEIRNSYLLDEFFRSTAKKEIETIFLEVIQVVLHHCNLKNLDVDFFAFKTDLGLINEKEPFTINFVWPSLLFNDLDSIEEFIKEKYNKISF